MHIFIMTDIEGISGIDHIDMIDMENECYKTAVKYLMSDVNAAISGAFAGGADKVTVLDGHGTGRNFIKEELDPRAEQLSASTYFNRPIGEWDIDAFFAIGCHAMAGAEKAFLDHTQSSRAWFDYKINGKSHGEIGAQAAFFGMTDIPLLMVTGDDAACAEAKEFVPDVLTVSVKKATKRNEAECIPTDEARELIFNASREALARIGEIKPYKIDLPVTVEVTHTRNDYCDSAVERDPTLKRCGRTVTRYLEKLTCCRDLEWF